MANRDKWPCAARPVPSNVSKVQVKLRFAKSTMSSNKRIIRHLFVKHNVDI